MNKVGVYTRISRSKYNDYNLSIENQIEGITKYCESNNFEIKKIYKDIGISGKDFNRKGYKEMLTDIENGVIDTIIVKDLSRLGRDHLVVGKLLEEDLLINDIRLIAIDDNYDNKELIDEFVAFRNIFNEMYLKDLQRKMQSSINYKAKTKLLNQRRGAFYGLVEDDDKLVIDEYAANVVRLIFKLSAENNYGDSKIANILSKMNILNPSHYRYIRYNEKANLIDDPYYWSKSTIRNILLKEEYTGVILNQKYKNVNGKTIINNEPIRIENGLPQIVSKEMYLKSLENRNNHKRYGNPSVNNQYKNFVYCDKCNKAMRYSFVNTMNKYSYRCVRCSNRIYEDLLYKHIDEELNNLINSLNMPSKNELDIMLKNKNIISKDNINSYKNKLNKLNNDLDQLFEEYLLGEVSNDEFITKKTKLEQNIIDIEHILNNSKSNINVINQYYEKIVDMKKGIVNVSSKHEIIKSICNKIKVNKISKKEYVIEFDYKINNYFYK